MSTYFQNPKELDFLYYITLGTSFFVGDASRIEGIVGFNPNTKTLSFLNDKEIYPIVGPEADPLVPGIYTDGVSYTIQSLTASEARPEYEFSCSRRELYDIAKFYSWVYTDGMYATTQRTALVPTEISVAKVEAKDFVKSHIFPSVVSAFQQGIDFFNYAVMEKGSNKRLEISKRLNEISTNHISVIQSIDSASSVNDVNDLAVPASGSLSITPNSTNPLLLDTVTFNKFESRSLAESGTELHIPETDTTYSYSSGFSSVTLGSTHPLIVIRVAATGAVIGYCTPTSPYFGNSRKIFTLYDLRYQRRRISSSIVTVNSLFNPNFHGTLTVPSLDLDPTALGNYADDTAAAAGGVGVGSVYRNGSQLMIRVS